MGTNSVFHRYHEAGTKPNVYNTERFGQPAKSLYTSAKFFTLHKHIDIMDDKKRVVYSARTNIITMHDRTELFNSAGKKVALIEKKFFTIHERHYITMSNGEKFEMSNEILHIIRDITNIEGLGWQLRGNIAELNFEGAADSYKEAFKHISHGQEYTAQFIQQAFTLLMYTKDKESAVQMWNFGAEKKLFASLDEKFFRTFNSNEQFWVTFAPAMFKDEEKSFALAVKDYTPETKATLKTAVQTGDFKKVTALLKETDINSVKIDGVSPLYFAIQTKATVSKGSTVFAEDTAQFRADQLFGSLDLKNVPANKQQEMYFKILHQMRESFEKSGLGKVMFNAWYCSDEEIPSKVKSLEKVIELFAENTKDINAFKMHSTGNISNTALLLAAELDDVSTSRLLLQKNGDPESIEGYAEFSMKVKDGEEKHTEIPNNFIYRLISFNSWNTLKMYLTEFTKAASRQMTERSAKCDITPLVYLIATQIYTARNEKEFSESKKLVDELLPLFQNAGSKLEQNTAFGTARQLLGL